MKIQDIVNENPEVDFEDEDQEDITIVNRAVAVSPSPETLAYMERHYGDWYRQAQKREERENDAASE